MLCKKNYCYNDNNWRKKDMLNDRQMHVIDLLNDKKWITGKEMAHILNVTDRTIRNDIEHINQFYDCLLISADKRKGYHIDQTLLSKQDIEPKEIIPQTSHERCVWLIQELLFKESEINLIQLQDRVFISGYSIDNDLKKIRRMISSYSSLKIVRNKNTIYLVGDEADKRKLYKDLLTEETKGNFMNLNSIADLWENFDLLEVKDILEEVCEMNDYYIRDVSFPMIMIHAGVSIERIINHNYIEDKTYNEKLKDSLEYKVAKDFFSKVSQVIHIPVIEDEVVLFSYLLLGKSGKFYNRNRKESENLKYIFYTIIDKIKEYFGIDLSNDYDLKLGLITHLQSLLERQVNNVKVTNLYLKEIKRKYPLVFEMAVHSGEVITECTGYTINENELAFLALHLGAAYERSQSMYRHRGIVIIPHNQMLSIPCVEKLKNRFGERMEILEIFHFFEELQVEQCQPDFILTTVPLKHQLDIPTLQITLFVNNEDESKVFQLLNELDNKLYHNDVVKMLKKLIKENLFHVHQTFHDTTEILNYLCDELIDNDLATKAYKEDVFKREAVSATSFMYGFAVPHSIEVSTKKSCISVLILDRSVKWGEFDVKFIILLGIRETDNHLLKIFFDWLSSIVANSKKFEQLLEVNNYEEFMKEIIA